MAIYILLYIAIEKVPTSKVKNCLDAKYSITKNPKIYEISSCTLNIEIDLHMCYFLA